MNTMHLSPKNPLVLAVLGVGALWLLTQRKASAATRSTTAAQAPATMSYLRSPAVASQYAAYGAGRIGAASAQQSATVAGIGLLSKALDVFKPSAAALPGIVTGYNPGTLGTGVSAEYDLNSGEAQAAEYYSTHADEFIAAPVVITQAMQDAALLEGMSEY